MTNGKFRNDKGKMSNNKRVAAVIVAAGKGERFGSQKQFEIIRNKRVLDYSIDILKKYTEKICVVVSKDNVEFAKSIYNGLLIAEGGAERINSVYNGLCILDCDIVLIHDAARPLIDEDLVERVINNTVLYNAAVPATAISETLKKGENGFIKNTINRGNMYAAQTPQGFKYDMLLNAYKKAIGSERIYTDDSSVWEKYCGMVKITKGSSKNIKITTKEDLELAKCLLK